MTMASSYFAKTSVFRNKIYGLLVGEVVTGSDAGLVYIWDTDSREVINKVNVHVNSPCNSCSTKSIPYKSLGKHIVAGDNKLQVVIVPDCSIGRNVHFYC